MADIYIARQPIFDRGLNIFAYELLFRAGGDSNSADVIDGDSATSRVLINALLEFGLENIVGSHKAFFNLTRVFISNPELIVLPPDQIVLEVLEDIEPNETILNTLRELKRQGHTIALDDYSLTPEFEPYLEVADIVKLDVMGKSQASIEQEVRQLRRYPVKLLAEKVETYEEFEFLSTLDFDYFQGYFFSKPAVIKGKGITPNQVTLLNLIARINDPDVEVDELGDLISTDVSLSHKALKFINSPITGLRAEVESIRQAVVLLGLATIKNWIMILALANGSSKPLELSKTALIRARCCELLAQRSRLPKPESFFTVGLFSALDALMDQPLEELLQYLPLAAEAKDALLQHSGVFGEALVCTLRAERGDFEAGEFQSLDSNELADAYLQAMQWADQLFANF